MSRDWKASLALLYSQTKPLEPRELERQVHIEQVAIEHEELVEHILTGAQMRLAERFPSAEYIPHRNYSTRTPAVIRREWAGRPRPRKKQRYLTCICRAPTVAPWSFCDDCLRQAEVGPYRPPKNSLEDDPPQQDRHQRPPKRQEYTSIFEDGGIPVGTIKPKQSNR